MYVNNAVLSAQHTINGGGIKPPATHSSFNFMNELEKVVDPLGVFRKTRDSSQHFVDTADHMFNRGLDAGENLFDEAADGAEKATKGLNNLITMMTKFAPVLIGGVLLVSILK